MNHKFVKTMTSLAVAALLIGTAPTYALADTTVPTNAEVKEQKEAKAIVHFVNSSKTAAISSMVNYITNPSVYEKDGVSYLRIDVQQVYDVKITVEGKEGVKVAEYEGTTRGRNGEEQKTTYFTFDYALSDVSKALEAEASYFVPQVFTEPQKHGLYIVINNDVEASLKEIGAVIEQAEQIEQPSAELSKALATAVEANSYLTKKVELEKALSELKTVFAAEPIAVPVHFVNESDTSKLSTMGNYLASPKTYEKDGVAYLRLDVQQSYDVKVLVEGKEGSKVGEYKATIQGRTGPQEVTYFTFDYALSNVDAVLEASASYFVPGVFEEPQSHGIKLVIGEDVTASKEKLVKAISAAETIAEPSEALATAIQDASTSDSYLLSTAELAAATSKLIAAAAKEVSFNDVTEHWAKESIATAVATGIASGYPDGSFKPAQAVTRAEFTKLLVEALDLPASNSELSFSDADSIQGWAQPYVKSALQAGVINGYSDGSFRANGEITRAEMAVMVVKALKLELKSAEELNFDDADSIQEYAKQYVATAVASGLVEGLKDNQYGANEQASRAQAVTIVLRALTQQ